MVAKPCVTMMAHSQCEPDESWHCRLGINHQGRRTQDEPTLIITQPPQACTVGAGHDGCISTSASFMALMQRSQRNALPLPRGVHPFLWDGVNLDSLDNMTFFHCSSIQCCAFVLYVFFPEQPHSSPRGPLVYFSAVLVLFGGSCSCVCRGLECRPRLA